MKKYIILLLLIIATSLGLCGCAAKELDIEYVEAELQYATITQDTYGTNIESFVLESRATDKEKGIDIFSFIVTSSNEYIRRTDRVNVIYRLSEDKKTWSHQCNEIDKDFETTIEILLKVDEEDIISQVKEMPSFPLEDMACIYQISNVNYVGVQAVADIKITTDSQNTMLIGEGSMQAVCEFNLNTNSWKVTALTQINVLEIRYDIEGMWRVEDKSGFARSISGFIYIYNYEPMTRTFNAYVDIDNIDQSWVGTDVKITGEIAGSIQRNFYDTEPVAYISGEALKKSIKKDGSTSSEYGQCNYAIPMGKRSDTYEREYRTYYKISEDEFEDYEIGGTDIYYKMFVIPELNSAHIAERQPELLEYYLEAVSSVSQAEMINDIEQWLESSLPYAEDSVVEYGVADIIESEYLDLLLFYNDFCGIIDGEFYSEYIKADDVYTVYPNRLFYVSYINENGSEIISRYTFNGDDTLTENILLTKTGNVFTGMDGTEITEEYYNGLKEMYLSSGTLVEKATWGDISLLNELK